MRATQPIPLLVGVGQVLQRLDDPREAAEPLAMMVAALEEAGSPDRKIAEDKAIFHEPELARGMNSASDIFAVIESAIRFAKRETLEAHAVAHQMGQPRVGHASCLTDAGKRTWAMVREPTLLEAMMREEFCGRRGRVDGHGQLSVR